MRGTRPITKRIAPLYLLILEPGKCRINLATVDFGKEYCSANTKHFWSLRCRVQYYTFLLQNTTFFLDASTVGKNHSSKRLKQKRFEIANRRNWPNSRETSKKMSLGIQSRMDRKETRNIFLVS